MVAMCRPPPPRGQAIPVLPPPLQLASPQLLRFHQYVSYKRVVPKISNLDLFLVCTYIIYTHSLLMYCNGRISRVFVSKSCIIYGNHC